jgi:hypothetical protein
VALAAGGLAAGAWLVVRGRRAEAPPGGLAEPPSRGAEPPSRGPAPRSPGPAPLLAIAVAAVALPLLLALTGIDDHFFMRNLLVAWAALAAVVAIALVRARAIPLAVLVVTFAALAIATHADWRHQNADWEGALGELGAAAEGMPVVVLPGFDAPVASAYLDRGIVVEPVVAQSAWVVVGPGREGRADLTELRGYPRAAPPGFRPTTTRTHHGFRMILIEADRPTTLDPRLLGPDQLDQQAAVLPPRP